VATPPPRLLTQEQLKLVSYGFQMWQEFELKPTKHFAERGAWAYPGSPGLPKFFGYPISSQERVMVRTLNFVHSFIGSITTIENPMKNLGKVGVSIVGDPRKFLGHPYTGHIARSSLR